MSDREFKCLVVDDSTVARNLVKQALQNLEFNTSISMAKDGEETYQHLFLNEGEVDLVVLDINMPKATGPELVKKCQGDGLTVPYVIIVSTENEKGLILELLTMGVRDYLLKPYEPHDLRDKLNTAFEALNEMR